MDGIREQGGGVLIARVALIFDGMIGIHWI